MSSIIGADAARLAGLQIDTLQKVRNGQLTLEEWERFNNLSPEARAERFGDGKKPKPEVKTQILVLHKTVNVDDAAGKKTSKCLTGNIWGDRDDDIDRWLPAAQPTQAGGPVGVYQLQKQKGTTFREMAAAALQVGSGTALELLGKALKEQGRTFTLPAIEKLVERQEGGEDVGLRTDGYANFFFVENSDGSVSVLNVNRNDGGWRAYVHRLDYDDGWRAGCRLLLRNSFSFSSALP